MHGRVLTSRRFVLRDEVGPYADYPSGDWPNGSFGRIARPLPKGYQGFDNGERARPGAGDRAPSGSVKVCRSHMPLAAVEPHRDELLVKLGRGWSCQWPRAWDQGGRALRLTPRAWPVTANSACLSRSTTIA